jgi:formimidoylglutamate deiminase
MTAIFAQHARLPDGDAALGGTAARWARGVRIEVDAQGNIGAVAENASPRPGDEAVSIVLPGMADLHSHAFQRAMAGLAETAQAAGDDFWSWREWMYRFMARLTPEDLQAIAAQLYLEKLQRGCTAVVEFHYVHHDPQGRPYADPAHMGHRLIAAAQEAGIGLTLAPVLYTYGGFGRAPLQAHQQRFATQVDDVLRMLQSLRPAVDADAGQLALGLAPHSLRAVEAAQIHALLAGVDAAMPMHIHAAEQTREVDACLDVLGCRPVRHLLDAVGLDARWCVVHATHLSAGEVQGLAASGAVAGLCPSTEANLGDGLFPFVEYAAEGGRWGLGGDAHVCRDPFEELRAVEYAQRLARRRRNLAAVQAGAGSSRIGDRLWDAAVAGGAQASGRRIGRLAPGYRADLVVARLADAAADAYDIEDWLNQAVFGGGGVQVAAAMVGGRWQLRDGQHRDAAGIHARYRAALARLIG